MKRNIEYRWRARELMARHGMRNTRELVEPLRERGITLSESQISRMVSQNPERTSIQLLAARCDIFGVEANEASRKYSRSGANAGKRGSSIRNASTAGTRSRRSSSTPSHW